MEDDAENLEKPAEKPPSNPVHIVDAVLSIGSGSVSELCRESGNLRAAHGLALDVAGWLDVAGRCVAGCAPGPGDAGHALVPRWGVLVGVAGVPPRRGPPAPPPQAGEVGIPLPAPGVPKSVLAAAAFAGMRPPGPAEIPLPRGTAAP